VERNLARPWSCPRGGYPALGLPTPEAIIRWAMHSRECIFSKHASRPLHTRRHSGDCDAHVCFVPHVGSIASMSMLQTPKTTTVSTECAWRSSTLRNTHIGSNVQTVQAVFGTACYMQLIVQVHVRVEIPTKLSNDERKIVEELQEIQSKKPVKKKGFSIF